MKDVDIEAALAANRRKILSVRRAEGHDQPELSAERLRKMATRSKRARGRRQRSDAEAVRWARKLQRLMQGLIGLQVASLLLATAAAGAPVLLLFCGIDGFGMAATLPDVQRHHALCTVFNLCYLLGSVGAPVALSAARSDEDAHDTPAAGRPVNGVSSRLEVSTGRRAPAASRPVPVCALVAGQPLEPRGGGGGGLRAAPPADALPVRLGGTRRGGGARPVWRAPLLRSSDRSATCPGHVPQAADLRLVRGLSAFTVDDAESAPGQPEQELIPCVVRLLNLSGDPVDIYFEDVCRVKQRFVM